MKITKKYLNGLIALLIVLQVMLFADVSQVFVLDPTSPGKWGDLTMGSDATQ